MTKVFEGNHALMHLFCYIQRRVSFCDTSCLKNYDVSQILVNVKRFFGQASQHFSCLIIRGQSSKVSTHKQIPLPALDNELLCTTIPALDQFSWAQKNFRNASRSCMTARDARWKSTTPSFVGEAANELGERCA